MKLIEIKTLLSIIALFLCTSILPAQDKVASSEDVPFLDYSNPGRYVIKDIRLEGIKTLSPETLIAICGMRVGDTVSIPGQYISDATRKLWSQRYFSDIKAEVEFIDTESVNLVFYMSERPKVYNWTFTGVSKSEREDLLEKSSLKRGAELSDFRIATSIDLIKNYFKGKSFLNSTVEVIQTNDTTAKNAVNVTFAIDKGSKVKIGKIEFEGNEVFNDRTLRRTLKKTKQKSLNIFTNTKFKEDQYDADKENLIDFYNSKGYRNSIIVADSIYDINSKRLGIKLRVEEGLKFYYRDITWIGNSKLTNAELDAIINIRRGDTYDSKTMNKRLGIGKGMDIDDENSVSALYQNDGYLTFRLEPQETVVGVDSLDIEMKLVEGKQAYINRVGIMGNEKVNDPVIRRELEVIPGELYNRSLLVSSIRRVAQMGFFNPEALEPDINPVTDELVDVTFKLEESPNDRFEVSGGWGADMFVGSVGIVLSNFSARNLFKKGQWTPYPSGQAQQLTLRGNSNGSYYKSFSASFTEPWLGGKKPHSLTVSFYYSDQTNAYYIWQKGDKHFSTVGGSVGFGRRLKWPDRNFTFYTEFIYQRYMLKDWDRFIITNGNSNIFALKLSIDRNTVDQPIYPRTGSDFMVSVTLTPPYSLFDGKDYKSPSLNENERYKWIEYHKWALKGQWFFPVSNSGRLVVMAKAEMGFIGDYNSYKPSPFEGYQVGGDGMSGYNLYGVDIVGLRGYSNAALTESGQYSRAYNKYTAELRFPFLLKAGSSTIIYGLAFAEAGNGFTDYSSFDPFLLKRALGVGLRVNLPMVGLIGVDWGYGFDKTATTGARGGPRFAFVMGQQF